MERSDSLKVPKMRESLVKPENRKSQVFYYDELPNIASCNECEVLVATGAFKVEKRNSKIGNVLKKMKKRQSQHDLHSFGLCNFLLLEYECQNDNETVNFQPRDDEIPVVNINLNRILENSLSYIVKDSKVWQEFHLDDNGKKRSFVLKFQKGEEFDKFYKELKSVTDLLENCKLGKLITNKRFYLLGFKNKKVDNFLEETILDEHLPDTREPEVQSTPDEHILAPPFSPRGYNTFPQANLRLFYQERKEVEETSNNNLEVKRKSHESQYHSKIFGSLPTPVAPDNLLHSVNGNASILSILEASAGNRVKGDFNFEKSIDITEVDFERTLDIADIQGGDVLERTLNITDIKGGDDLERTLNITDIKGGENLERTLNITDIQGWDDLESTLKITDIKGGKNLERATDVKGESAIENIHLRTSNIEGDSDLVKTLPTKGEEDSDSSGTDDDNVMMPERRDAQQLRQYATLLQAAINDGDRDSARQYAEFLAVNHVKVSVNLDENCLKAGPSDQDIKIKVFIEDKESTGGSLLLTVKPSDTIGDLKTRMFLRHKFPTEVQKWIVSKRIPKDDETLKRLHITDGMPVFLYLVSAKSVGLDRKQHMTNPGYMDMTVSPAGLPQVVVQPTKNDLSPKPLPKTDKKKDKAPKKEQPVVTVTPQPAASGPLDSKEKKSADKNTIGWHCGACTFLNIPTRPGCEMCASPRPKDYKVPENYKMSEIEKSQLQKIQEDEQKVQQLEQQRLAREALESQQNYQQLVQADHQHLVPNIDSFDCPICFDKIPQGRGVVLRECLHSFCKDCLKGAIIHNEEAYLRCPFQNDRYSCNASLQDREIKALVPEEVYERYLQKSLSTAESQEINSFHCKTPDCQGWCIYEDHVNFFRCMVCKKENCLTCKAIHQGMNCKKYQDDILSQATNNAAARRTRQMLYDMVKSGDAMHCPQCKVILQKKDGCDWIKCSICKTEICWVTKGPRWGPLGQGDTSGGCKCRLNGEPCHPDCNNCH